jgi:hypothetical protein
MKRRGSSQGSRPISRRRFLKLAAATGLLVGCNAAEQAAVAPTAAPSNTPVPAKPATLAPTGMAADTPIPPAAPTSPPPTLTSVPAATIKFYPDAPSQVIHTHHAGVWQGDQLSPEALRQMLDASITKLTGLDDPRQAWAALFRPNEKVAIKINTFINSLIWTHAPLVQAVVAALQEAGVPAEQIVLYDHLSMLEEAGFQINKDGPGVRCFEETEFGEPLKVADHSVRLSSTLQSCDALINMPVLKSHMISGLTFALKNHYGSVDRPDNLHYPIEQALPELNALAPIKERTRLVIGDVLEANLMYRGAWPYWKADWRGDSILMSFDPVAHDTLGTQVLERLQAEKNRGLSPWLRDIATAYLKTATDLGLGTNDPQHMQVEEIELA